MKNAYKKLIISAKGSNASFYGFLYLLFPQKTSNYFSVGLNWSYLKILLQKGWDVCLFAYVNGRSFPGMYLLLLHGYMLIFILDDFNQSPFQYQGILL